SQLKRRKLNGSKDGIKKKKAEDEKVNKDNKEGKDGSEEFETKMYRSYIKSALEALDENSSSSSSTQIDTLTSQIGLPKTHPEAIKPANFVILLNALTNSISRLDSKRFDNLIIAIINYSKWYSVLTAPQVNVFKRFVITLCSYLPKWWGEISQVIIKQFTVATDKTKHHHELLKYFVQIIPTSIQSINKCLVRNFPNKNNGKAELVNYVGNLLNMMSYCTELRFNIWSLIIERTIQIDVELQNELDELDDDEDMDIDDDESDSDEDDDDDDTDSDGEVEGESGAVAGLKRKRKVRFQNFESAIESEDEEDEDEDDLMEEEIDGHNLQSMAITDLSEKLDCILSLVFQNISAAMSNEIEEEQTVIQFNTLISLFKSHILPTYFTKSTQFILFYFTQLSPELTDSFLVTLIDVCFAQNETIDKRIKALQYLSSYLSRAKNLQKSQICFIFSYLTNWLNRYVEEREVEIDGNVNMDRFKLFYSTFQVLLYVFCFRHSMLKNQDTDEWELDIDKFFQRMIITKFNPLKYCNENVVMMFGKISQEENVAYCFSIIQKNKNEKLKGITGALSASDLKSSSSSDSSASLQKLNLVKQQFVDLEGYFPFDPLFLKSSKRFIKDFYVEWTDIKNEYSSDSDSEDFDDLANDAIREVTRRNSMAVAHDEE
ncbi:hypothetical protein WICPIJ_000684, partial [Wickerhamomyces pijperi]